MAREGQEEMSKLEKLLANLCPNGVEYKKLGDVAEKITDGMHNLPTEIVAEGGYPIISAQNVDGGKISFKTGKFVSKEVFDVENKRTNVQKGDVLLTIVGAIGRVAIVSCDEKFLCQRSLCVIKLRKNQITSEFLRYVLESEPVQRFMTTNAHGAAQKGLYLEQVAKIEIPVPPLEVQEEIVRILDAFTELTAELTAELRARQQQYEHYRDALLSFDDVNNKLRTGGVTGKAVAWKTLGEIATITRGGSLQKKDFAESGVPCIHYGQIYTRFGLFTDKSLTFISADAAKKQKFAEPNDIVMAVTSENIEDVCKCVAWLGNEKAAVSGHTAIIHHNQNAKYLSYYFHTSKFFEQKRKLAHGTKVIEVTPDKLADIKVPVPSLAEQKRIVAILDRFDSLVNSISEGLPAEIEARRKQYEFYRDKLLSFKRVEVA